MENEINIKNEREILKEELTKLEAQIETTKTFLQAKEQLVDELKAKLVAKQSNELDYKEIGNKIFKALQDKMVWKGSIVLQKSCNPTQKHYLGDVKWVLYQYICELNAEIYTLRCGKYAFNKISNMQGFEKHLKRNGVLNLNGDEIIVVQFDTMDKKQIIISPKILDCVEDQIIDTTIYPDDIVLYFA